MFEGLSSRLDGIFKELRKRGKLNESDVDAALREIRLALLEADVHYSVVKSFVARVRERAIGAEVARSLTPGQQVVKIVYEELINTLGEPGRLDLSGDPPHVIMLVGLQGSGKTTTAAKLALHLRRQNHRPLMIAADTYRPAAIEQLQALGRQLDIPVYSEGADVAPPLIAGRGVRAAGQENASVVIIDTAGRLQIDDEMMAELAAIRDRVHPQETLLVADSMTGQEAVNIAQGFSDQVGITGLILTKVDGDARGGAAISMREVTGVPIKFLGTGEKIDGLEVFHPDRLARRILGMGDVLTLIERAEAIEMDEAEALALEEKFRTASFTLEDYRKMLQQVKRMGPLSQVLELVPGAGEIMKQISPEDIDRQLKRVEAIINSMTLAERERPRILNASRRKRIAAGSGTSVQEVNQLLKQFRYTQRMMEKLSRQKPPANLRGLFR
ncbi:MAG TPA: signal recognition particle protein [Chloroflexi bacterium]|nr:signal recognition particle protein [Chloroflexota bacterium]